MLCYIFDIDGTIADCSHRIHLLDQKLWREFFARVADDKPIPHILGLAQDLARTGKAIVYVSGRSDECRAETLDWMMHNRAPSGPMFMRAADDHRPDFVVKSELLDKLIASGYQPIMAFDDRNSVVRMWRERGIPCAQVAEGDF
jgi:phosphatidate phosphatase APP1